jgi:hypothetical protein
MTSYLDTAKLHVGQVAAGTDFEGFGPVLAIEPCGCGGSCVVFGRGVEVPVHTGDLWPIRGAS